VLIIK
jgi:hypothetical protein